MFQSAKTLNFKASSGFRWRFFCFALVLVVISTLLQPIAALADEEIIDDTSNANNPAQQEVVSGSPDPLLVVTETIYSTSTPEQLPVNSTEATSSPETTIVESESTTTPETSLPLDEENASSTEESALEGSTLEESALPPPAEENNASSTNPTALEQTSPESEVSSTSTIEIINTNDLIVKTISTTTADTGLNEVTADDDIRDTEINSGDVNVYANVLTIANINLVNSQIVEMNENFNNLAQDLFLNQPELSAGQRTQDLVSPLCSSSGLACQSITTFKLSNKNTANVENDVTLSGNSGSNALEATGDIRDSSITTGDVKAVVNVLNIINANAVNSRWTIVTFNVFGDWDGDLVMPSEMYFSESMSIGEGDNSALSQVQKVILDINNNNTATINNNVTVNTETGSNAIETTAGPEDFAGDIRDSGVTTGNGDSNSIAKNVSNLTLYNSRWFLGLVNIMGDWSGQIYSLPDSVAVSYQAKGFTFVSSSDPSPQVQAGLLEQLQTPNATSTAVDTTSLETGDPDQSLATSSQETLVEIDNTNEATINNNITVNATSGQNAIEANGDIRDSNIRTGNATALANILNFANLNLINSDLHVGLVNIFGKWQGNIVFGYPDLSVSQSSAEPEIPSAPNSPVTVKLDFTNPSSASINNSKLEWKFDANLFMVDAINTPFSYTTAAPGEILFALGKLGPNHSGSINISLKTALAQAAGIEHKFFAHIFGNGPEKNLDNNQNILSVLTDSTGPVVIPPSPSPTPTPSPATGGGGGGGSSSGGGGGGGVQTSSGTPSIGLVPNLMRIYKTNTASGSLKPGDKVHFTITVDNDGNNTIRSLVVYDTLRGPDNTIINNQTYNIAQMAMRQETKFSYDLVISATAAAGTYTNSAYVQGLNDSLQTVRSEVTAISSFTVADTGQVTGSKAETFEIEQLEKVLPTDTASSTASSTLDSLTSIVNDRPQVLGESCVQPGFGTNLRLGQKSEEVRALQVYLNNNGFVLTTKGAGSPGSETNLFGALSKIALTKFQQQHGIKERGSFGLESRNKLNVLIKPAGVEFCPPPQFKFSLLLKLNSSGDEVLKLQQWLNTHGFVVAGKGVGSPGQESRAFGQLTKAALIKMQHTAGIKGEDGSMGTATRDYLNSH